jgi:signal transduction histidine kinase/putative methionine-R-sulfoxide reductase with GAF domain
LSIREKDAAAARAERMERQLKRLREFGLVLESTMGFDEILTLSVEQITDLMEAERSTLYVVCDDGCFVSRVIQGEDVLEIRLEPGQGIAGWVARTGRALNVPDASGDERFDPSWDGKSGFKTKCVICHPIRNQSGETIGVVEVLNKRDGSLFDEADFELLGLMAGRLALQIENSRLVIDLVDKNRALVEAKQKLEESNRELDLLLDLEQRVAQSEDINELSVSILKRVMDVTDAWIGMLYRPDETGAELKIAVDKESGHRVVRVGLGSGIAGWVASKGQELNIDAPASDPRFTEHIEDRIGIALHNVAAVPLLAPADNAPRGSLLVANKKTGAGFRKSDVVLLKVVAARFAQAVEDMQSREKRERERRLATVGRLLAGVLHDLKSPISVISGCAELLAAQVGGSDGEEYLERTNQALFRITKMTQDIIAFSRGEKQVLVSSVLLGDVIDEFLSGIKPLLKSRKIELTTHIRLSGAVRLDREKIIRAFNNIVQNAVEAMDEGGNLTFEVDQLGGEIVFGFTDTGPGIAEEIQGSLFQSFVTLGKIQGTGLGLAVAREIVDAHEGAISFTTMKGKGTTFLVSIPAAKL